MNKDMIVVAILLGLGLFFVVLYWLVDILIFGLIGYVALCFGHGLSLWKALFKKKQQKKSNTTKDDISH